MKQLMNSELLRDKRDSAFTDTTSVNCVPVLKSVKKVKKQSNPCTGLLQAQRLQEVQAPVFRDHRHLKVVSFPAIGTGRL